MCHGSGSFFTCHKPKETKLVPVEVGMGFMSLMELKFNAESTFYVLPAFMKCSK
jgi:hypothetical protein